MIQIKNIYDINQNREEKEINTKITDITVHKFVEFIILMKKEKVLLINNFYNQKI